MYLTIFAHACRGCLRSMRGMLYRSMLYKIAGDCLSIALLYIYKCPVCVCYEKESPIYTCCIPCCESYAAIGEIFVLEHLCNVSANNFWSLWTVNLHSYIRYECWIYNIRMSAFSKQVNFVACAHTVYVVIYSLYTNCCCICVSVFSEVVSCCYVGVYVCVCVHLVGRENV